MFATLLRKLAGKPETLRRPARPVSRSTRLQVEALEGRTVPSTVLMDSPVPSGGLAGGGTPVLFGVVSEAGGDIILCAGSMNSSGGQV
jgi:hypothetical protein